MSGEGPADTGVMTSLKRRETAISLVRTSVRYAAYGLALVLALGTLSFGNRIGTVAGASLIVVLVGFAAQRFLTDILAGFFMFFEGWFSVGDNITIEPLNLQGVVDEVGLRSTRLRAITGEVIRVHNSQILSVQVQPRGAREVEVEFFATSEEAGRELVAEVARLMPAGPTRLVRAPWVEEAEHLDDDLVRIRARATVAYGREWLVETFLPDLLKERGDDVIVHGPIVWHVDETARARVRAHARHAAADALSVHRGRMAVVADPNVRKAAVRPTPEQYFMLLAVATRERAACLGRHVGAMLVADQRIIATGYNGTPTGFPNCDEGGCHRCAHPDDYAPGRGYDVCICVHAEQNAVLQAARLGLHGAVGRAATRRCAPASAA